MKNIILAIVVTYNRLTLLKENIESLLNQSYNNFDILVVDNKSTDGTDSYLNEIKSDRIKVITTEKNIGGAGGFNIGIRYAIENGYGQAWLMDDDTIPEENSLKELVDSKELLQGEFSFLASYVKWTDGSVSQMNASAIKDDFLRKQSYELLQRKMILLDRTSFVSCFVNLDKTKNYGLPIKEFFIYYDDAEYTKRISKEFPAYLVLDSVVVHKMRNNESTNIEKMTDVAKINRIRYDYRNGYKYCKDIGFLRALRYNVRYFYHVFKILFSNSKFKFKKIKEMTIGMCLGLFFNPKIEYVKKDEI